MNVLCYYVRPTTDGKAFHSGAAFMDLYRKCVGFAEITSEESKMGINLSVTGSILSEAIKLFSKRQQVIQQKQNK